MLPIPIPSGIPTLRPRLGGAALALGTAASLLLPAEAAAQQEETYDYWAPQREMIRRGQQAVFLCNGLFTSHRTVEQVWSQELAFLPDPVGTPAPGDRREVRGDVEIDRERRAVRVGDPEDDVPAMRAAFREGIGCVILAPDQGFDDIDGLPEVTLAPPPGDPETLPWPEGDRVGEITVPDEVDADALQAASDWAFDRPTPEQVTLSLVVVHDGEIIHERYAPGVDVDTRTRTWSTAKSIAATLIGILVDDGRLSLDGPLELDWNPDLPETDDPRDAVTLRHLLHMSSGLYPVDAGGLEYATGSGMSYWAGASSVEDALDRGLIREPGTFWEYENYETLLAVHAMKRALGDRRTYLEFPRRALLDRIGMRNTLLSTDRFGDFILSSQVYTNARDLARFGILWENRGVWPTTGERIVSEEWIDFATSPAPSTAERGNVYGAQFWLVPDARKGEVPPDAYSTAGNRGQFVVVVPSHDLVIVRRGLDWGRQGFDRWDLAREVLKAFE
jgi:CubicO group peptidase (beta-lactamase class C family)